MTVKPSPWRRRKPSPWLAAEPVIDLEHLVRLIEDGRYVYWRGKLMNPAVLSNMTCLTLRRAASGGSMRAAKMNAAAVLSEARAQQGGASADHR